MKPQSVLRTTLATQKTVNRQSKKLNEKKRSVKRANEPIRNLVINLNRRQVEEWRENQNRSERERAFAELPPLPEHDSDLETENNDKISRKMDFIKRVEELKLDGNLCENWRRFKRNYAIFSSAAGVDDKDDKVKVNTFLNAVGPEAVEIFDTFEMTNQERLVYATVVAKFEEFCKPRKNTVYERFVFYQRVQRDGEPFDTFLMDIKRLVRTCEFGATENEMLRDRIVLGVADKKLQKRLLETSTLTYDIAVEKARANEATAQQSESMNKSVVINEVQPKYAHTKPYTNERYANNKNKHGKFKGRQQQQQQPQRQQQQQQKSQQQQRQQNNENNRQTSQQNNGQAKMINNCSRCGHSHKLNECPAYGKECRSCSKLNHYASMCRMRNVNMINANDEGDQSEFYVNIVEEVNNDVSYPWTEKIKINGKDVTFKIDTGAEIDVLPVNVVERLGCVDVRNTAITLRAFGGHRLKPTGMCSLLSSYHGITIKSNIAVVDKNFMPILGLKSCIRFGIVNPKHINKNSF